MWWLILAGCWSRLAPAATPSACDGVAAADGFDLPIGPPDGVGYYDAQPFGVNQHLGSDWNGIGGGDTDYGDPVYAAAAGRVVSVEDVGAGWGVVVRVAHAVDGACVESLYAHLSRVDTAAGATLRRGERLGAIGDAGGRYKAHLHFELRDVAGRPLGGGYGAPDGQVDPTAYIRAHRVVGGRAGR